MAKRMMLFEHKKEPVLSHELFVQRMLYCTLLAVTLLFMASALGAVGYHYLEQLTWLDSFLNAVMIMTGLGLQDTLVTSAGKLFTIVYSLISPIVFYSTLVIFFTPLLHRFLHLFHLDLDREND